MPPIETLIQPYIPRLQRWCRRRCRDVHEAEDLAQETILQALARGDQIREPDAVGAFLFRIAERKLIDSFRRRVPATSLQDDHPAPPPRAKRPPSPEVERLCDAIGDLPSKLRRPVRLHYLQGHTLREVATRLRTTVMCVKTRLYRARQKLREEGL